MRQVNRSPAVAFLTLACVLACLVAAQPVSGQSAGDEKAKPALEPPKTPKARAARQRLDAAIAKADEARRVAAVAAHKEYVRAMEDALKVAAAAGNTDEVALIAAAIKAGKQQLAELNKRKRGGRPEVKCGKVLANKGWQPVLKVKKGQVLKITATGEWIVNSGRGLRSGPAGAGEMLEGNPVGMLLARIGEDTIPVGAAAEITVTGSGLLEMKCNDSDGHLEDNAGHLEVTIEVE